MGHIRTSLPQGMCNKFQEGACAGELLCSSLPCNWRDKKTSDLPNFLSCLLCSVIWIKGQGRHWMERELLFAAVWLNKQLWMCRCSVSFPALNPEKHESHQIILMKETPWSPTVSVHQPQGLGCWDWRAIPAPTFQIEPIHVPNGVEKNSDVQYCTDRAITIYSVWSDFNSSACFLTAKTC